MIQKHFVLQYDKVIKSKNSIANSREILNRLPKDLAISNFILYFFVLLL
jgi:hypothetical protein